MPASPVHDGPARRISFGPRAGDAYGRPRTGPAMSPRLNSALPRVATLSGVAPPVSGPSTRFRRAMSARTPENRTSSRESLRIFRPESSGSSTNAVEAGSLPAGLAASVELQQVLPALPSLSEWGSASAASAAEKARHARLQHPLPSPPPSSTPRGTDVGAGPTLRPQTVGENWRLSGRSMRQLAATVSDAEWQDHEPSLWLSDGSGGDLAVVERWLNTLLERYVDSHSAHHAEQRAIITQELEERQQASVDDAAGDFMRQEWVHRDEKKKLSAVTDEDGDSLASLHAKLALLTMKEESLPGVLCREAGEKNQRTPLQRLGLSSTQLAAEEHASAESIMQIYRTIYDFVFGFHDQVGSILAQGGASPGVIEIMRGRLWNAYRLCMETQIEEAFGDVVEGAQLAEHKEETKILEKQTEATRKEQQVQLLELTELEEEIAKLRHELQLGNAELAHRSEALAAVDSQQQVILTEYQSQITVATLRRFEIDERLERAKAKKLLGSVFGAKAGLKSRLNISTA